MIINKITKSTLENWPAKIVCFVLALLLFLFYRMSSLEERYFSVPLEIETNLDYLPASTIPKTVKITLKGENEKLYPILEQDVKARVDFSKYNAEGEYKSQVQAVLTGTALNVKPLEISIEPDEITLKLEKKATKKVVITPSLNGYPESGYEFNSIRVNPSTVEIIGPHSSIANVDFLVTENINLANKNQSFGGEINILNKDDFIKISGQNKVVYNVYIEKSMQIKNYNSIPIKFNNLDYNFKIEPQSEIGNIKVSGSESFFYNWIIPDNLLTVNCSEIREPGTYTLQVNASIPRELNILNYSPKTIFITVTAKE